MRAQPLDLVDGEQRPRAGLGEALGEHVEDRPDPVVVDGGDPQAGEVVGPEPEVRQAAWQNRLTTPAWTAEPNDGHRAIVDLQTDGRLQAAAHATADHMATLRDTSPWAQFMSFLGT
ncbi:MAG: hypothetical protein ACPF9W_11340, partial [Nocardioides sp.]